LVKQKIVFDGRIFPKIDRHILLVGLMGVGKTTIGRFLAKNLGREFIDSDFEIESAARLKIKDIFVIYGEDEFRRLEEKVIARLLASQPAAIISSGSEAFLSPRTRKLAKKHALSVWLKADHLLLDRRTADRTENRPVLKIATLAQLFQERRDIYAEADLSVETFDESPNKTCNRLMKSLHEHLTKR